MIFIALFLLRKQAILKKNALRGYIPGLLYGATISVRDFFEEEKAIFIKDFYVFYDIFMDLLY